MFARKFTNFLGGFLFYFLLTQWFLLDASSVNKEIKNQVEFHGTD